MIISCAQKVGTENPRVPSSILGPATIFCLKIPRFYLRFFNFSGFLSDYQLTHFKVLSTSKCNQTVTKNNGSFGEVKRQVNRHSKIYPL